ncbi:hypothetical protein FDECE_166 [Fusarium decemcellulare]|nr:hypothetical protein FDECE_166 [Fusarium decemcellulare]
MDAANPSTLSSRLRLRRQRISQRWTLLRIRVHLFFHRESSIHFGPVHKMGERDSDSDPLDDVLKDFYKQQAQEATAEDRTAEGRIMPWIVVTRPNQEKGRAVFTGQR